MAKMICIEIQYKHIFILLYISNFIYKLLTLNYFTLYDLITYINIIRIACRNFRINIKLNFELKLCWFINLI